MGVVILATLDIFFWFEHLGRVVWGRRPLYKNTKRMSSNGVSFALLLYLVLPLPDF